MPWTLDRIKELTRLSKQATCGQALDAFQKPRKEQKKCSAFWIIAHTLLLLSLIIAIQFLFSPHAKASVNPIKAQRAIIGESANQGLKGMIAVAEVIRRRGNLKGLYGLKRDSFISGQPKWVHEMAKKAWEESATSNITKGATHFENTKDFGRPKWAKGMKKTVTIKDHDFFVEVSK